MNEIEKLVERLREHATDWNGEQMPDLEPAKGDPTAGFLREAATTIATLRERVKVLEAGLAEIDGCFQAAYAEGFIELRSEIEDLPECARLFDVLNRRIMFIEGVARSLLENTDG